MYYPRNDIREILAIARREVQMDLRFAISYLFQSIISPLGRLLPILTVYVALVAGKQDSPIPGVTNETYIPFLALGIIFHTAWKASTSAFTEKFRRDKWARTIELFFIAPTRTLVVIIGIGFSVIIQNAPTFIAFLAALLLIHPTSLLGISIAFLAFIFITLIGLSVGLIIGGLHLASENLTPFFSYVISGITFLAPFFYPLEIIQTLPTPFNHILYPLVRFNPLNSALNMARAGWLNEPVSLLDVGFVSATTLVLILISGNIFRLIWRKFGIQGV